MIQELKPLSGKKPFYLLRDPIILAFAVSLIYWTYLFFTSAMVIQQDAIGYQSLGTLIKEQGWTAYFMDAPKREPVYPFFIAMAMRLGKFFSVSYHPFQKLIQLLILFLTQVLALKILRKIGIRELLASLCILYIGISPALVNSALSLYSEIATYPVILSIILLCAGSWEGFQVSWKRSAGSGLLLGLALAALTFTKGIFEIISPVFSLFFTLFAFMLLRKKNSKWRINPLVFVLALFAAFYIPLNLYKSLNEKHNGNFTLTNRGAWALYGNTARRMDPVAMKKLPAALLYAPGEGVCKQFADVESCRYWSFERSDELGYGKLSELGNQGLSGKDIDKKLISLSVKNALSDPLQYGIFAGIESLKMIFWESTQIGFVDYPGWLTALFASTPFKNGLRLILSLLTFTAILFSICFLWRQRTPDGQTIILCCILVLIIFYIALHSFFFILTRYALPIAPLYLILIAFFFDKMIPRRKQP